MEQRSARLPVTEAITEHLTKLGLEVQEGSSSEEQLRYLVDLARRVDAKLIGEIGFNAGFSSYAFLEESKPEVKVVSFDIGTHDYVQPAKAFIDERFAGRHTLIIGDSRSTVPAFHEQHPESIFDLVFIDGGHAYEVAKADLVNMRPLSNQDTAIVMDDLTPWFGWGKGPTQAWTEMISEGVVKQQELFKDGIRVETIEPPGERSWALGHYSGPVPS